MYQWLVQEEVPVGMGEVQASKQNDWTGGCSADENHLDQHKVSILLGFLSKLFTLSYPVRQTSTFGAKATHLPTLSTE